MQNDVLQSKSKQLQAEVAAYWAELTAADLHGIDGKRDNLVGLLETRYGFVRRRAEQEVDWFLDQFKDRLRKAS